MQLYLYLSMPYLQLTSWFVFQGLGYRVIPDAIGGFVGPLAGLHRGLSEASHQLVVTAPCDSPFLPLDLVAKLHAAPEQQNAELAVARTAEAWLAAGASVDKVAYAGLVREAGY